MQTGIAAVTPTKMDVRQTALDMLLDANGAVGELVRSYTAKGDSEDKWLDSWFLRRTQRHFTSSISVVEQVVPIVLAPIHVRQSRQRRGLRLVSIRPHYFRGFKILPQPINLTGSLIVIEGKNSTGKTGLTEALEFLFRGSLSRREELGERNPGELGNCIENQLRPKGEDTFVEATFSKHSGTPDEKLLVLRRLLTKDYGTTSTSNCESELHVDGTELSKKDEAVVLEELFSLVPPILMQHTLRSFVQSPPSQRRQYFERILSLNELTALIGSAVIGDSKLPGFKSPQGSYGLSQWESMIGLLRNPEGIATAKKVETVAQADQAEALADALIHVASLEFACPAVDLSVAEAWIDQQQQEARQKSFPPLAQIRPKRQPNHELSDILTKFEPHEANLESRWNNYESARTLANAAHENALVIANALENLIQAGLIDGDQVVQVCPLCAHEDPATLTQKRLLQINDWKPLVEAERHTRANFESEITGMKNELRTFVQEANDTLPDVSNIDQHLEDVSYELVNAAGTLIDVRSRIETDVRQHLDQAQLLINIDTNQINTLAAVKKYASECTKCVDHLKGLPQYAEEYRQAVSALEMVVGQKASSDKEYKKRQSWDSCVKSQTDVLNDFRWEKAKAASQKDLANTRVELMKFRAHYLEGRRAEFSEGMEGVWSCLREDTYSVFSSLSIPKPRGKGFPVVLEVKALLDDDVETKEIDALKVFSESQVNALGIAAFVTRSRLLEHEILIFDDPVQSMDEDHFKTFARNVLPSILDEGRQIVLLTHNEAFARDLSYWHYARSDYSTLKMRMSQKDGCLVDEGNRRFSERLRVAESLAKAGHFNEAWMRVRFAIERLYTICRIKYGPCDFDPYLWKDQGAEYMWSDGSVGNTINGMDPDAGKRLKEILIMTGGGAHDKEESGFTELKQATKYLRELGSKIKIAD